MDSTSITALSVLGGSLVGALTSLASTWLTQQHLDRRELLGKQIANRETLYASFISEASLAVVDSLTNSLDHRVEGLIPLYTLLGHIRLSSSERVVTAAETVIKEIIDSYLRPNLSTEQVKKIAFIPEGQNRADPLGEFSHVCREELQNLTESASSRTKSSTINNVPSDKAKVSGKSTP